MAVANSPYRTQVLEEVEKIPEEYLAAPLKMVRVFHESIILKPAAESFRQGCKRPFKAKFDLSPNSGRSLIPNKPTTPVDVSFTPEFKRNIRQLSKKYRHIKVVMKRVTICRTGIHTMWSYVMLLPYRGLAWC